MNISINIIIDSENKNIEKYDIVEDFDGNAKLIITTKLGQPYNKIIHDTKKIKKHIKNIYKHLCITNSNNELDRNIEFLKKVNKLKEKEFKELLDKNDYINILGNNNDIKEYIDNNNKYLKNKKIILTNILKLDRIDTYTIRDLFLDYKNIYVRLEGNKEPINIDSLDKTLNIIDYMVEDVKRFNFSPIEQLMYIYDKVRNRVYKEEDKNESNNLSRDLTQVLLGKKIVCEGFANEFNAILKKLGFNTITYRLIRKELLNGKKVGHIRNMVYIKDEKHKINGIYFFDTTWDSRRDEVDNKYLLSYKFFAKTKKEIESSARGIYEDITLPYFNNNFINAFTNIVKTKGLKEVPKKMIETINTISRFIDGKSLITPLMIASETMPIPDCLNIHFDLEHVINKFSEYDNLFNSTINAEEMLKILFNVRKNEYYQEPYIYPFSIKDLYITLINSNWIFKNNTSSLLMAIFGYEVGKKLIEETKINMHKYIKTEELDKKIEQIKLVKVLKDVYDKR